MYKRFQNFGLNRPRLRKSVGWVLIVFGFLALVTPLTPGGLLFFVGLELAGIRLAAFDTVRAWLERAEETLPVEAEEQLS